MSRRYDRITRNAENKTGSTKEASPCADPESFVRGGPTFTTFFFKLMRGREDPNTTINGPSSARQRNAIKWRFAGVPMMAQH